MFLQEFGILHIPFSSYPSLNYKAISFLFKFEFYRFLVLSVGWTVCILVEIVKDLPTVTEISIKV